MTPIDKKEIIDLIRMLTGCARKLQEYLKKEENQAPANGGRMLSGNA